MDRSLVLAVVVCAATAMRLRQQGQGGEGEGDAAYEAPDLFDQADAIFQEFSDMNSSVPPEQQGRNLAAFMPVGRPALRYAVQVRWRPGRRPVAHSRRPDWHTL